MSPAGAMRALNVLGGRSIAVRLAVSSLLWSFGVLLVAGLILAAIYRETTERAFDARLLVYANDLASDLVEPGNAEQRDGLSLGDPRFDLPLSGWYWQVGHPDALPRDVRSSRSLFGAVLTGLVGPGEDRRFGEIRKGYRVGPEERELRIVERDIDLGEDGRVVVRVSGPADEIHADVRRFNFALTVTFTLLGIVLGLSALVQIRFGLRPLTRLRSALSAVRRGEADKIPGDYPRDIAPLAQELNLLIDANREILERARTQVGNLAHALKTPLSVIVNEVGHAPDDIVAQRVREQADIMRDQVNYHLERARAAALAGTLGSVTEVEPVIASLTRTFEKIYRDRDILIAIDVPAGARFRGERQDFEEMTGNLIDNACKWAAGRVAVEVALVRDAERTRLRVAVEDDGAGLPEEARASIGRGRRLDETKPGSGLGLSIVADLAALYHGSLKLEAARLGGLRTVLDLPGNTA